MRRLSTIGLALVAFGAVLWTPSLALPAGCTKVGTPDRDILAGTAHRDVICALGSGDYIHGAERRDRLLGMGGGDTLVGGQGRDVLKGGGGPDRLFAIDQHPGDVLYGGSGEDHCYTDRGDVAHGCEHVNVGASPAVVKALSSSFLGVTTLGEIAQEALPEPTPEPVPNPTPAPPPAGGGTFPACTPPPDDPPDFC